MNDATPSTASRTPAPWTRRRLDEYFRAAAFIVLLVVGAIATLRAYLALETAIVVWLRPQFTALAQAAFSIVILAIVVWLIRAWVIGRAERE